MINHRKILTVTPFFPPDIGGISSHVLNLNTHLINHSNAISVLAPKHLWSKMLSTSKPFENVFRINSVYLPGWPYPTLRSLSIPMDLGLQLDTLIRKGNFDIIHVHGHHYPISWLAINSARKYNVPCVLTLHGMYALNPNVLGGKSLIEDCFNKYIFPQILLKTNAVIGLTDQITNYAKKFGKMDTMYFTIPNGVNTRIYKENLKRKEEYRQKYGFCHDTKIILFCGRFERVKGVIEFAKAVKEIIKRNNIEVVIVGEGSLESQIKAILNGVERIHMLKWVSSEIIHELYLASDIFINPSRFEALPITIVEAMNAGLHIVYTPVGGIPDILKDYMPKTLLTNISSGEIQNTLTNLISNFNNIDLSSSLRHAQKFDWEKITTDTLKVYEECINI